MATIQQNTNEVSKPQNFLLNRFMITRLQKLDVFIISMSPGTAAEHLNTFSRCLKIIEENRSNSSDIIKQGKQFINRKEFKLLSQFFKRQSDLNQG